MNSTTNSSKLFSQSQVVNLTSAKENAVTKGSIQGDTNSKLKQEVQQLQHKLKLRTKAVTLLQNKLQTPKDLEKVAQEIEKITEKNDNLQQSIDGLIQENQVLGQIIDKMKSKVQTKSGIAVEELENAFIELNNEYEETKRTIGQTRFNQFYEKQIANLTQEVERLTQDCSDRGFRISQLEDDYQRLRDAAGEIKDRHDFYKEKFMEEAKDAIRVKDSFRQVIEDNKTHVQYIQVLEKRIRELESQAQSDIDRMHKRINELRLRTLQETALMLSVQGQNQEQVNLALIKAELIEEQRSNLDLKQQLHMLSTSKDQTQASLAVCRHNLLQSAMKLEEESRRVVVVERMRLEDMAENEKLRKMLQTNSSLSLL